MKAPEARMKWLAVGYCLLAMAEAAAGAENSFLIRGATIHPVSSPGIANGSVLVRDGRIVEVGVKVALPKGVRLIDARGLHVYPGMIDSATQLGLTEVSSLRETQDVNELGLFKPQLRAAIAVNPASEHIAVTRANGITAAITAPAGPMISGQAALIHLDGWTTEELALRPSVAMLLEFPQARAAAGRGGQGRGGLAAPNPESRRRYEQQIRQLDEYFEEARRYQHARAAGRPDFRTDLKFEAMLPVLEGRLPVLIRAEREKTIREAIRFAEKQKIHMILQHGTDAWKVASDLAARQIPVVLGPTLALPAEEDDPYDRAFTSPNELLKAGVKVAFASFGPSAQSNPRNLPYQAAAAVAFGMPVEEAWKAVTLAPAEIWGVSDELGSIEKGKRADLILTDGDPLEIRTQIKQVFIDGRSVDLDNKHKRLYDRYISRP